MSFWDYRRLSVWAYIFLFGAFFGYFTFDNNSALPGLAPTAQPVQGETYLWLAMGVVGILLTTFKDQLVRGGPRSKQLNFADVAAFTVLLVIAFAVPASFGLARAGLALVVMVAHTVWFTRTLYSGQIYPLGRGGSGGGTNGG